MDGISDVVNSKDGDSSIARTDRSSHPEMPVKVVVNALLKININKVVCHPSTSSLVIFCGAGRPDPTIKRSPDRLPESSLDQTRYSPTVTETSIGLLPSPYVVSTSVDLFLKVTYPVVVSIASSHVEATAMVPYPTVDPVDPVDHVDP